MSRIDKKDSYADQAERVIREAIVNGYLPSGSRHSVDSLIKELMLDLSRTPVREALLKLSVLGMVVLRQAQNPLGCRAEGL